MFLLLSLVGCPTGKDSGTLTWYTTCGDPVCEGYSGPFDGVSACTTEAEGAACPDEGTTCDPEDDCNALLICATEDPKDQTGGCPISLRAAKRDVHYLSVQERAEMARRAREVRLATWSYTWDTPDRKARLGFVIDDDPAGFQVDADGRHVDLYGYTSLALAATQDQEARLAAQEAKIAEQERRISEQDRRIAELEALVRGR